MPIATILMLAAVVYFYILPTRKDRIIPVKKLIIMPLFFLIMFYTTVISYFTWDAIIAAVTAAGLIAGIFFGVLLRAKTLINTDKVRQLIALPGSYLNIINFVIIFMLHFVLGYVQAVYPHWLAQESVEKNLLLFLLAGTSALNTGMSSCLFYKYYTDRKQTLMLVS
jgi:hypothetical protein